MQDNIKSKTRRTVTISLIYTLVLIFFYAFVGRWVSGYSERLKSELVSQSEKSKEYQDLIRAYPDPEQLIENVARKIQELKDKAASREQIPRIIQLLTSKTSELDISVISIKPLEEVRYSDEKLIEGVNKVYIEIVILAPYKVIGDYLEALTELPIILTVESLTVDKAQELALSLAPTEQDELLVTLLLSAYMVLEI